MRRGRVVNPGQSNNISSVDTNSNNVQSNSNNNSFNKAYQSNNIVQQPNNGIYLANGQNFATSSPLQNSFPSISNSSLLPLDPNSDPWGTTLNDRTSNDIFGQNFGNNISNMTNPVHQQLTGENGVNQLQNYVPSPFVNTNILSNGNPMATSMSYTVNPQSLSRKTSSQISTGFKIPSPRSNSIHQQLTGENLTQNFVGTPFVNTTTVSNVNQMNSSMAFTVQSQSLSKKTEKDEVCLYGTTSSQNSGGFEIHSPQTSLENTTCTNPSPPNCLNVFNVTNIELLHGVIKPVAPAKPPRASRPFGPSPTSSIKMQPQPPDEGRVNDFLADLVRPIKKSQ
jgi:hypothetical protein